MDGGDLPEIPVAGGIGLPGRLLSFLGFLVVVRYSFLAIHAVDRVKASPPAMSFSSFAAEQLLTYYLVWMLGLLAMLLPPLLPNYPSLRRLAARAMNSLFTMFNHLPPIGLMNWHRFGPQFASFLGFLVTVRYSFLIVHAVDQMQASPPAMCSNSFTMEHEQLLAYYLMWMLGLLVMLLPPLLANSPSLMRLAAPAMNSLFTMFNHLPPVGLMNWHRFGPQFASFLGFLVTVRYSFLIVHAVDQMQASPPAMCSNSFTMEHEQLLAYYLMWMLGLLVMLLPPLLANSPSLMRLAAPAMNSLFTMFNHLPPVGLMNWHRFGPQFASFLGFLVTVRYSFLIVHAVDQMQASPPAMCSNSFTMEHEQLLAYYLMWMLGLLVMLLPPLLANSPSLMRLAAPAMSSLFTMFNHLPPVGLINWHRFGPQFASFLGFLVTVRYSFLIVHAVDQMQASTPARSSSTSSFTVEHEQLLAHYLMWTLGFLTMLLPPLLANSQRFMRFAARSMNSLFPTFFDEHA